MAHESKTMHSTNVVGFRGYASSSGVSIDLNIRLSILKAGVIWVRIELEEPQEGVQKKNVVQGVLKCCKTRETSC
jgi:hypothetical protein